jgi:hypothetical protein
MPAEAHHHRLMAFRAMLKPVDLSEDYAPAFSERAAVVATDMESYLTKSDLAMNSTRLTRQGQVQELTALSVAQRQELAKTHSAIRAKLSEQIASEREKALRRPDVKDPMLHYFRSKDIVEFFNSQDATKHRLLLEEAKREKDLDFLDALATAPRYNRKYDVSLVNEARAQLAEEANPTIAKLSQLRGAYDRVFETAQTIILQTAEQAGVRLPKLENET